MVILPCPFTKNNSFILTFSTTVLSYDSKNSKQQIHDEWKDKVSFSPEDGTVKLHNLDKEHRGTYTCKTTSAQQITTKQISGKQPIIIMLLVVFSTLQHTAVTNVKYLPFQNPQGMRILSNVQLLRIKTTIPAWSLTLLYWTMTAEPLKKRFLTNGRTRLPFHQKTVELSNSLLSTKNSIQEHTPARALQPIIDTLYTPK